eukprot:765053-Hanusia_phi.AAC.2
MRAETPVYLRKVAVPDCEVAVPMPAEELDSHALQLEKVAAGDLDLVLQAAETLELRPRLPAPWVDEVSAQLGSGEEPSVGGELGDERMRELFDKRVLSCDEEPERRSQLPEGGAIKCYLSVDDGQQDLSVVPVTVKSNEELEEFDTSLSKLTGTSTPPQQFDK